MGVGRIHRKHLFFNNNIKRQKSSRKHDNAIKRFLALKKKENISGMTKWLEKTYDKCLARIKKFGISSNQIETVAKSKGINL